MNHVNQELPKMSQKTNTSLFSLHLYDFTRALKNIKMILNVRKYYKTTIENIQ